MNSGSDTAMRTARATVTSGYVRAEVLDPVLFDVPDRRVRGNRHLGQRHVAEQPDAASSRSPRTMPQNPGPRRHEEGETPPVDVDVVAWPQAERERRRRPVRRPRSGSRTAPSPSRARSATGGPSKARATPTIDASVAATRREQRVGGCAAAPSGARAAGRVTPDRATRRRATARARAACRQEADVVPHAVDQVSGTDDDVEVLPQPEHVEHCVEHAFSEHRRLRRLGPIDPQLPALVASFRRSSNARSIPARGDRCRARPASRR